VGQAQAKLDETLSSADVAGHRRRRHRGGDAADATLEMKTLGQIAYDCYCEKVTVEPNRILWAYTPKDQQKLWEQIANAVAEEVIRRQSGTSIETGSVSGPSFKR
jgi:hypothetical protein